MKALTVFLISAGMAFGQGPGKTITFNRADTAHCKVISVSGRPLLESTYEGISVAVAIPMNRGNGDFLIFVAVSQAGTEAIEVNPKEFYGVFSDKDHTRCGVETSWRRWNRPFRRQRDGARTADQ